MSQIIYNLSNEDYHHSDEYSGYISSSQLKNYARSPLYAHLCMTDPNYATCPTEAMRKGTLLHDAIEFIINGGSLFDYISTLAVFQAPVNPKTKAPFGSTTNAYMDAWQKFLSDPSVEGRTVVSEDDIAYIRDIVTSATSNEYVRKFMATKPDFTRNIGPEMSFFYDTRTPLGNDLRIKVRPDLLTSRVIVDWKTTSLDVLSNESIGKTISDFDYAVSACLYQYVVYKMTGRFCQFVWVFIQNHAPYEVAVAGSSNICFTSEEDIRMFDEDTDGSIVFNPGVNKFRDLLHTHIRCIDLNRWPGAESWVKPDENGLRIFEPEIPSWQARKSYKSFL